MDAERKVRVGPLEIAYEARGSGERPLVLVHGFTGSKDDFSGVLDDLAEGGRVVAPDQRGHGGSTNTGDPAHYTLECLVDDLEGFLDATGISRCDLLGHSMGGMVTLRLALTRPARVASLVLMDTAPGPLAAIPPAVRAAGARIAREQGMDALFRILRARIEGDAALPASLRRAIEGAGPDAYFARIERKLLAMDPEAFAALSEVLSDHASVAHRLSEIRVPTTVLVGAEDVPFLEPSARMARAIPGARHVVVPDAAHSPQIENRDAWLAALRAHLAFARATTA